MITARPGSHESTATVVPEPSDISELKMTWRGYLETLDLTPDQFRPSSTDLFVIALNSYATDST